MNEARVACATRASLDLCFSCLASAFFLQLFFLAFAALAFFLAGSLARVFPNEPAYNLPRLVRRSPLPIRLFPVLRTPPQCGFDFCQLCSGHSRNAASASFLV